MVCSATMQRPRMNHQEVDVRGLLRTYDASQGWGDTSQTHTRPLNRTDGTEHCSEARDLNRSQRLAIALQMIHVKHSPAHLARLWVQHPRAAEDDSYPTLTSSALPTGYPGRRLT